MTSSVETRFKAWLESQPVSERRKLEAHAEIDNKLEQDRPEEWPAAIQQFMLETGVTPDELFGEALEAAGPAIVTFAMELLRGALTVQEQMLPPHVARPLAKLKGIDYDALSDAEKTALRLILRSDESLVGTPWQRKPQSTDEGDGIPLGGVLSQVNARITDYVCVDQDSQNASAPAVKPDNKGSVNDQMMVIVVQKPDAAMDWTIEQFMAATGAKSKSTIAATATWRAIMMTRNSNKLSRMERDANLTSRDVRRANKRR